MNTFRSEYPYSPEIPKNTYRIDVAWKLGNSDGETKKTIIEPSLEKVKIIFSALVHHPWERDSENWDQSFKDKLTAYRLLDFPAEKELDQEELEGRAYDYFLHHLHHNVKFEGIFATPGLIEVSYYNDRGDRFLVLFSDSENISGYIKI